VLGGSLLAWTEGEVENYWKSEYGGMYGCRGIGGSSFGMLSFD
jgi:hypothetical protein